MSIQIRPSAMTEVLASINPQKTIFKTDREREDGEDKGDKGDKLLPTPYPLLPTPYSPHPTPYLF
jgi:hypothetical protein